MVWVSTLSAKRSRRTGARPGTLETARPGMGRQVGLLICPTAAVHCASQHTDKTANAPSIACGKFKRTVELGRHHKAPLGEGLVPSSKISAACSWAFRVRSQPEHSAGGRRVAILSTEKTQFRQKYEIGIACWIPMFGNANGRPSNSACNLSSPACRNQRNTCSNKSRSGPAARSTQWSPASALALCRRAGYRSQGRPRRISHTPRAPNDQHWSSKV